MSIATAAPKLSVRPPRATRRERWAWCLYDFGNWAYAAVVLLAVYAAHSEQTVVGGVEGSRLWGLALAVAMVAVALTSPLLCAVADYAGRKKRFLLLFTALAVSATAGLFFAEKGDMALGMGLFILAEFGYRSAQVFYNALLPEIAHPDEIASISGNGWAVGSAGGIVCLLIILPLIMLFPGALMVRISLAITAGLARLLLYRYSSGCQSDVRRVRCPPGKAICPLQLPGCRAQCAGPGACASSLSLSLRTWSTTAGC